MSGQADSSNKRLDYHYCSSETFMAICNSRRVRFSDLTMSNDSGEIGYGLDLLNEFIEGRSSIERKLYAESAAIHRRHFLNDLWMGYCLSLTKDVLSQWRGYADDGRGVCIGFNPKVVVKPYMSRVQVIYDRKMQLMSLGEKWEKVMSMANSRSDSTRELMASVASVVSFYRLVAYMKHESFAEEEEEEVRYIFPITKSSKGYQFDEHFQKHYQKDCGEIEFFMRASNPVPYVDVIVDRIVDRNEGGYSENIIKEVVLGPKNSAKEIDIQAFLATKGFANVEIGRSVSTYR